MTDTPARTPYLGKYTLVLLGGVVALMMANAILLGTVGVPVPSGAATIIPPMIAALVCGQAWGRDKGVLPENRAAWRFAGVAAVIFLAVQIPLTFLGLASIGPAGQGALGFAVILLVVTTGIVALSNRWFVTIGAKGVIKAR